MATRPRWAHGAYVRIAGGIYSVVSGNTSNSIHDRPDASVAIDLAHLPAVDLSAPLQVLATVDPVEGDAENSVPTFTGHAVSAETRDGALWVEAEGALEMVESAVGLLRVVGVPPQETIDLLARQAGFPSSRLAIEGMDDLPLEVFVVEMPVIGVSVDRTVTGPEVELLPINTEVPATEADPFTEVMDDIRMRWGQPTSRARTYVTSTRMYEAEQEGIRRIEHALDALLGTAVYGLSRDPWQRDIRFSRASQRARPTALPVVFTQGAATGRRWLHSLADDPIGSRLDIGAQFESWAEILSRPPSGQVSRALRALRHAADEGRDAFERCHALSNVLEFYAASSKPPRAVSKRVMRNVSRAIRHIEMTDAERDRLTNVCLGTANNAPLMARVRHQANTDGTPISSAEWALIEQLRSTRNDSVHGRGRQEHIPDADDLRWGVSLASRLVLYRWAVESGRKP